MFRLRGKQETRTLFCFGGIFVGLLLLYVLLSVVVDCASFDWGRFTLDSESVSAINSWDLWCRV